MPTNDYIQPFFNIKGEFITHSYRKDNLLIYEVMLPVTEHTCPYCGHTTKYIKDYRVRTINLGSIHGLYICAKYKQRRYFCPQYTHSFSEENPFIQRYKQLGMTTIAEIFRLLHEGLNYTTIARACHVSVTTVIRITVYLRNPSIHTAIVVCPNGKIYTVQNIRRGKDIERLVKEVENMYTAYKQNSTTNSALTVVLQRLDKEGVIKYHASK